MKKRITSMYYRLKPIVTHPVVLNKYMLTFLFFLFWLLFFDEHNLISQIQLRGDLKALETDMDYYHNEIKETRNSLDELLTDNDKLEKFAREKYMMKKEDEEVFIIVNKD